MANLQIMNTLTEIILAAAVSSAASVQAAPRTTEADFFGTRVDCSIPALRGIPAKMSAGDAEGAKKVFADYVRATLDSRKMNPEWHEESLGEKAFADLRKSAEETMDYRIVQCGVPYRFENRRIDWTENPTYNNYEEWTWQLNRHLFLTTLAEYYVRTGDERAAETWRDMVSSWIDQACPPKDGTPAGKTATWRTLDTGIRIASWCRQISAFAKSPALDDEFMGRFFRSVCDNAHRLEKPLTGANWRILELNGLLHVAMVFPFLADSHAWRESALAEFEKQLGLQLYPDGFQFELAPGYHGCITKGYTQVVELFRMCGEQPPAFVLNGIERSYEMYPRLTRPDRFLPPLNDSNPVAIQPQMEKAAPLYPERKDFLWFATGGAEGCEPAWLSCAFPYAGAVVFRSSWSRDAVWGYMDCSPFGRAHQHEDKLNVLISAYGKNMLVEGGKYAYDTSIMRKYVISTRAHNTVLVDGREQCIKPFYKWDDADISKKADMETHMAGDVQFARASYTAGYGRADDTDSPYYVKHGERPSELDQTVHERITLFFKNVPGLAPFFVYVDRLKAPDSRERTYDVLWHLETCAFSMSDCSFKGDFGEGIGLSAVFSDKEAKLVDMKGTHNPYQGWMPIVPPGPHEHRPVPTPVLKGRFSGTRRIVSVFYPWKDGADLLLGVKASSDSSATDLTLILADGSEIKLSEPGRNDVKDY